MPRFSIGKRSRLIVIFYQYEWETSGKKYDRFFLNNFITRFKLGNISKITVRERE
jgi:hypothetical protein